MSNEITGDETAERLAEHYWKTFELNRDLWERHKSYEEHRGDSKRLGLASRRTTSRPRAGASQR